MRFAAGWILTWLVALAVSGCKPLPPCPASDTSCWPCTNPGNTNPSCQPFPADAKRHKEQTR